MLRSLRGAVLLTMVLGLLLAACGSQPTGDTGQAATLQAQVNDLQNQVQEAQAAEKDTADLEAKLNDMQSQLDAAQNPVVVEFWTTDNEGSACEGV